MITKIKKRIIPELENFPEDKTDSLLDYILFLKFEDKIKTPNKITEQTLKDTDKNKNLNTYSSLDEFFQKMES